MPTILLAEADAELNALVRHHLQTAGHRVVHAFDGRAALRLAKLEHPDLLVLDAVLPLLSGLQVLRRLVPRSRAPILLLVEDETQRTLARELGARDYLSRPFSALAVVARIAALLRRIEVEYAAGWAPDSLRDPLICDGALQMDLGAHTTLVDGRRLRLTPKEFDLLAVLVRQPGRAFARDDLLVRVWGYAYGGVIQTRTVDAHVVRLRRKLGATGGRIETVWGMGYRFAALQESGGMTGGA